MKWDNVMDVNQGRNWGENTALHRSPTKVKIEQDNSMITPNTVNFCNFIVIKKYILTVIALF